MWTFKTFELPDENIIIDCAECFFRCVEVYLHCPCSFMNQMLVQLVRTDVLLAFSTSLLTPDASVADELLEKVSNCTWETLDSTVGRVDIGKELFAVSSCIDACSHSPDFPRNLQS